MDDELRAMIAAEAKRLGMTESEFMRQGIVAWLAWHAALRSQGHGEPLGESAIEHFLQVLQRPTDR